MAERVRICDIAEELGLSTATVSNVIHGKTNKVSTETAERVTALLEERQYIPSMAGILLAQNSSKILGVFVNDHPKYEGHTLDDFFIASSLNALSAEIERGGQFMMVKRAASAEEIVQFASMWNMDGIVVIGFCEQDYALLRRRMRIPFAVYDGICRTPRRFLISPSITLTADIRSGSISARWVTKPPSAFRIMISALTATAWQGFAAALRPGAPSSLSSPCKRPSGGRFTGKIWRCSGARRRFLPCLTLTPLISSAFSRRGVFPCRRIFPLRGLTIRPCAKCSARLSPPYGRTVRCARSSPWKRCESSKRDAPSRRRLRCPSR